MAVCPTRLDEQMGRSPTRRLIVPRGATAWWGVDPSTRGVSIASVSSEGARDVSTVLFPRGEGGERLASIHRLTRNLASDLLLLGEAPGLITVEQPSGA